MSNPQRKSARIGREKLAIARYRYLASRREGKSGAKHRRPSWGMVVESLFYKAELDVRPPPPRRNYLAGDQCSSTDKAMKEHGWDPRLAVLKRGPKMKAEPSSSEAFLLSCLPFVSLRVLDDRNRRNRQFEPRPRSQQVRPVLRRSKNKKGVEPPSFRLFAIETLRVPLLDTVRYCRWGHSYRLWHAKKWGYGLWIECNQDSESREVRILGVLVNNTERKKEREGEGDFSWKQERLDGSQHSQHGTLLHWISLSR